MQLKMCSRWGDCSASRDVDPVIFPEWYSLYPGNASTPLHCWDSGEYGPVELCSVCDLQHSVREAVSIIACLR